jgi:endonuclease/exonuclease/phosphatase (EEP) superfamily protein YafD
LLSIPIDHCLISPDIKVVNIRTGPNVGSDHRPLITDLIIPEKKG